MLSRKSLLIFANNLVGAILGFVALKLVALYMGAGEYGKLGFATSLVGTLTFLTDLGIQKAHQKRVSEGRDLEDCIATFAVMEIGLIGLYLAMVFAGVWLYLNVFGGEFFSTTRNAILLVAVGNAAKDLRRIGKTTFMAQRQIARRELAVFTEHLVRAPSMVIFAIFYAAAKGREGPIFDFLLDLSPGFANFVAAHGADFLAVSVLLGGVASAAMALGLLVRNVEFGSFRTDLLKAYVAFAAPVSIIVVADKIAFYIDKVTLGFFWGDVVTGQYFGVERVLLVMNVLNLAIGSLLFPEISSRHSRGDIEGTRRLTRTSLRYMSMVAVPMAVGISVLAEPFIRILLSADFLGARIPLSILAFTSLVTLVQSPLNALLYGSDRPRDMAVISVSTTVVNAVITLLLVPSALFGVPLASLKGIGAASGTLVAAGAGLGLKARMAPISIRGRFWLKPIKHLIAGTGMGLVVWSFHANVFALVRWFHSPVHIALGAVTYVAFLWLLQEFDREDGIFFWKAVHPGELGSYIREEIVTRDRDEDPDEGP